MSTSVRNHENRTTLYRILLDLSYNTFVLFLSFHNIRDLFFFYSQKYLYIFGTILVIFFHYHVDEHVRATHIPLGKLLCVYMCV